MASLSRKFLTTLGIDEDKADAILEKHQEVLTEVKDERDKYKGEAESLPALQKQIEELKAMTDGNADETFKSKYEELKKEFESFKTDVSEKEKATKKENAYKALLKEAGVSDKRISAIMKVTDLKDFELDDEGKPKEQEKYMKSIKEEWADFIQSTSTKGADTSTPPSNSGKTTLTKEQIRAIADPIARQKAMAENPSLFGLPENND